MPIVEVEGIVVSDTNYSETSKILTVLTKEYGKIGVLSKGCRSMKSKLRYVSQKMTYGTFYIHHKKEGLSTLTGVDIINPFKNVVTDITRISYVTYLFDLTIQVMKQTNENLFQVLIDGISRIEDGLDPEIITDIVELKYLEFLGVKPSVDGCTVCGNTNLITTISVEQGGYVCKNCYRNEKIYSNKMIKLIRMFYYVDLSKIAKIQVSDSVKKELLEFINQYYDKYTGLYLKSKQFLSNLKKLG